MDSTKKKICSKCQTCKKYIEFAKDSRNKSGIKNICKNCDSFRKKPKSISDYERIHAKLKDPEVENFDQLVEMLKFERLKLRPPIEIILDKKLQYNFVWSKLQYFMAKEFNETAVVTYISENDDNIIIKIPGKFQFTNTHIENFISSLKN
jgi:hypothetical protein